MADVPYLIALALLEQNGERAMPLQGKSLRAALSPDDDPGDVGRQQALELMVRVWQRSDDGPLRRAAAHTSLLFAAVPIEALHDALPALKAQWLNTGDTTAFLSGLLPLSSGVWSLTLEPRQPLAYQRLHSCS